jgi:predicted metal-dependent hydrolase
LPDQERTWRSDPERVERRAGGSPDTEVPPISRDAFKTEVWNWARQLEVEPKEVHLAGMRRKWGSCSTRARLTFDTALLQQPEEFRREAIVHELLHLRVRNHGPLFRALLISTLKSTESDSPDRSVS